MVGRCGPTATGRRRNRRRIRSGERAKALWSARSSASSRCICFAWDGTAVPDRDADATAVRSRVERLTALGVDVAVVSGADVAERRRPAAAPARTSRAGCSSFSRAAPRSTSWARPARGCSSGARRRRGGGAADAAAARRCATGSPRPGSTSRSSTIASTGGRSTSSRSGARPAGAQTSRSCRRRVDARLARAGVRRAARLHRAGARARSGGRPRAPGRHQRHQARRHRSHRQERQHARVLRALIDGSRDAGRRTCWCSGDEFGAVGDSEAATTSTLIPELRRAMFVSVGAEPNGVPPRRAARRRRPGEFLASCDDQLARREAVAQRELPRAHRRRRPGASRSRASTRSASARSRPGSRSPTARRARAARSRRAPPIARRPRSWPASTATAPASRPSASRCRRPTGPACGSWSTAASLNLANGEILEHERVLDMRHGVVYRYWRQRLRSGRTLRVRTARFASLADRQIWRCAPRRRRRTSAGRSCGQAPSASTHAGGPTKETAFEALDGRPGFDRAHPGPQRRRARAGGDDPPGARLARGAHLRAGARRDRRAPRAGRPGHRGPAGGDRLGARPRVPSSETGAPRPGAGGASSATTSCSRRHRAAWDAALARRRPARRRRRRRPAGAALQPSTT